MASTSKSTLTIGTPVRAIADFCLLPVGDSLRYSEVFLYGMNTNSCSQIGTSSPSVSKQITDVQRLMKTSGLNYTMHSAGTTVGN